MVSEIASDSDEPLPPQRKILVSIATYNERENLPNLVAEIFRFTPTVDILVVDDNSPDGTSDWCRQQQEMEPRLTLLCRIQEKGLGSATIAGLKYAIQYDYDYVINLDADFSHHPKYLPDLIAGMESAPPDGQPVDVMLGSRYIPGGGIKGWPLSRKIMSKLINAYAIGWLRLPVSDCSGSFRCYRTEFLKRIEFDQFRSTGYAFFEEILWFLTQAQARFGELPIVFVNREIGHSKITLQEALRAVWIIGQLGFAKFRSKSALPHDTSPNP